MGRLLQLSVNVWTLAFKYVKHSKIITIEIRKLWNHYLKKEGDQRKFDLSSKSLARKEKYTF